MQGQGWHSSREPEPDSLHFIHFHEPRGTCIRVRWGMCLAGQAAVAACTLTPAESGLHVLCAGGSRAVLLPHGRGCPPRMYCAAANRGTACSLWHKTRNRVAGMCQVVLAAAGWLCADQAATVRRCWVRGCPQRGGRAMTASEKGTHSPRSS